MAVFGFVVHFSIAFHFLFDFDTRNLVLLILEQMSDKEDAKRSATKVDTVDVKHMRAWIRHLERVNDHLNSRLDDHETEMAGRQAEIDRLHACVEEMDARNEALERKNEELTENLETMDEINMQLRAKVVAFQSKKRKRGAKRAPTK